MLVYISCAEQHSLVLRGAGLQAIGDRPIPGIQAVTCEVLDNETLDQSEVKEFTGVKLLSWNNTKEVIATAQIHTKQTFTSRCNNSWLFEHKFTSSHHSIGRDAVCIPIKTLSSCCIYVWHGGLRRLPKPIDELIFIADKLADFEKQFAPGGQIQYKWAQPIGELEPLVVYLSKVYSSIPFVRFCPKE